MRTQVVSLAAVLLLDARWQSESGKMGTPWEGGEAEMGTYLLQQEKSMRSEPYCVL